MGDVWRRCVHKWQFFALYFSDFHPAKLNMAAVSDWDYRQSKIRPYISQQTVLLELFMTDSSFSSCVKCARTNVRIMYSEHIMRLRWSRGSVLAFGTQVRGFKPDRSRWIFQGEKILSATSFGGEVKPSVPCRKFTASKRSLNVTWKSVIFRQNSSAISRPCSFTFGC